MNSIHQLKPPMPLDSLQVNQLPLAIQPRFLDFFSNDFFLNAKSLREQIFIVCQQLRKSSEKVSFQLIAKFFNSKKTSIWKQYQKAKKMGPAKISYPGRPSLLSPEALDFVQKFIEFQFQQKNPVTYDQLLDVIEYKFGITLKLDTLRHIVYSLPNVKVITGEPMDQNRVNASDEYFL